jgi:hypothetical protein
MMMMMTMMRNDTTKGVAGALHLCRPALLFFWRETGILMFFVKVYFRRRGCRTWRSGGAKTGGRERRVQCRGAGSVPIPSASLAVAAHLRAGPLLGLPCVPLFPRFPHDGLRAAARQKTWRLQPWHMAVAVHVLCKPPRTPTHPHAGWALSKQGSRGLPACPLCAGIDGMSELFISRAPPARAPPLPAAVCRTG